MLFNNFDNWFYNNADLWQSSWNPYGYNLEYRYDSDKKQLEIDLPGVKKESVSMTLSDSKLNINWTNRNGKEGRYSFYVNKFTVDAEAQMEDGVLVVTLKQEDPKSKKIIIK